MTPLTKCITKKLLVILAISLLSSLVACKSDDDDGTSNANETEFENIELAGNKEVPISESPGTGIFNGTYNADTKILTYTVSWTLATSSTVSAMHFHGPASTDQSAPPVVHISGFPTTPTGSYSGATTTLTSTQEAELLGGQWYINIHSNNFPNGEIRGNLLP
jgi:hypothetical protein